MQKGVQEQKHHRTQKDYEKTWIDDGAIHGLKRLQIPQVIQSANPRCNSVGPSKAQASGKPSKKDAQKQYNDSYF